MRLAAWYGIVSLIKNNELLLLDSKTLIKQVILVMVTITCKICEKQTPGDRLAEHSKVCIEVTKLRETLSQMRLIMENYAEKAAVMKNSLESYAARQKYSFSSGLSDIFLENCLKRPSQGVVPLRICLQS